MRIDDFDGNGSEDNVDIGAFDECEGNIDGMGDVDLSDLTLFLTYYGTQSCSGPSCDGDIAGGQDGCGDGDVDLSDLTEFLPLFGNTCGLESLEDAPSGGFDPQTQWIRSADPTDVLTWAEAGMPWPWEP